MRILVIPEDFTKDQYILKPIITRLIQDIGRRNARIRVCQDPRLGGIGEALKPEQLSEIVERYEGMTDIFVLCVDRDGETGRRQILDGIEERFGPTFHAENAWEEVETWVLAGLNLPSDWRWADVRAEVHVKERYFDALARDRKVDAQLGGGRDVLGREAAGRIDAIRQKCPEDFDNLARRLEAALQAI